MKIHFIAIGGTAMHNLAIALQKKGHEITGSDDQFFEPSKSRLDKCNLLPKEIGWFPKKITPSIDAIILGMHAKEDNPELKEALIQNIKVYSYPEFLYNQTQNKKRIVIGGSHGKTSITSMIMHVLKQNQIDFDYMVGASIKGFDTMVKLSENSKIAIFEGDEYLSSPIDHRPKFIWYKPHIALLSGIAWDHINVFSTFDLYKQQFSDFVSTIEKNGTLIYFEQDKNLQEIAKKTSHKLTCKPYHEIKHKIEDQTTYILYNNKKIRLQFFGAHNMQNLEGARLVCNELGINNDIFFNTIKNFEGAHKRLEILCKNETTSVFLDFAHSPSKLIATTNSVKKQYPNRKLIACMELHTYSSLNKNFLPQYKNTMIEADEAFIYYNPKTIEQKRLSPITAEEVKKAFATSNIKVYTESDSLFQYLEEHEWNNSNLLLMSSGTFSGKDLKKIAKKICGANISLNSQK